VSLAEAVLAEVRQEPADVLIVDCMLRNALSAAEVTGVPTAALVHVRYRHFAEAPDPTARWWDLEPVNETRERLGLKPVLQGDERVVINLWRRCDRALIVLPREFEDFGGPLPPNVRYVGPVFEGNEGEATWDLPWPPDHPDPLVLVSFSTTYMHHEATVDRVLAALELLPVRVLVTLGAGLEPNEVAARLGMVVRSYLPHAVVLPHASLVVTHGGMGTVMAAFASGVPMLCMPLGRDQPGNAERVEALGAGRTIASDASVEELRDAVMDVLGSDALRAGARRMAEIVAGYGRGSLAITELESLLASFRSA
jgi:MGT family glycosyltransferase